MKVTARSTVGGLCITCVLLMGTVLASQANAAATAFTCSSTATTKTFSNAHCTPGSGGSAFGHQAFGNTKTSLSAASGTAFGGVHKLRMTVNGINTVLEATGVSGSGELEKNDGTTVQGKGTATYTGVKVVAPAGKGCKVFTLKDGVTGPEGALDVETSLALTAAPPWVTFTISAHFEIRNCFGSEALEGLNKDYELGGNVEGSATGGEVQFTHAGTTTQNTLKLNGSIKVGYEGAVTIKGSNGNALALT